MGWPKRSPSLLLLLLAYTTVLSACASPDVIPDHLEPQVDKSVAVPDLLQNPTSYTGRTVVAGGEVLQARRVKDATELEILELPLDNSYRPAFQRTASRGRFIAIDWQQRDPAAFPPGMPITVVGEVTGARQTRQDEVEVRYPTLDIKHVHLWTDDPAVRRRAWGPSVGVGVGMGMGSGGYGGGFGGISIGTGF